MRLPPQAPKAPSVPGLGGAEGDRGTIGVRPEVGKTNSLDTSNFSDIFFFFFLEKPASALYFTVSIRIRF